MGLGNIDTGEHRTGEHRDWGQLEMKVGYRPVISQIVFRKRLFMSVMCVIIMLRQFVSMLVGMGSRSHDFIDEPQISF